MDDDTRGDGARENTADVRKRRRVAEHYLVRGEDAQRLHRTVGLAARALEFPVGQINILDDRFAYTVGDFGSGATRTPVDETMCQFVLEAGTVLAVDDLTTEPLFRVLPGVQAGMAGSYIGVPLRGREAIAMGSLCLFDRNQRHITGSEISRMQEFGGIVEDQLDLVRHNAEAASNRETSAMIACALESGEITPWYQPIVELSTGRRVGFEALARWHRSDGSAVSPERFVTAAEDSDLVVDMDRTILTTAFHDLARWRRSDPQLRININLSTRHLELPDGTSAILRAAAEAGLDPSTVSLEITETRALHDLPGAAQTVLDLRAAGFRVVLDDFGNGWSALEWVLGLGVDGVKIDRAVTAALGTKAGAAVSRAIVGMTNELDMTTTVEGISEPAHLEAARSHGFHYGQGYLWSPAVPAVVVDATL